MKKSKFVLLGTCLAMLSFVSCQKNEDVELQSGHAEAKTFGQMIVKFTSPSSYADTESQAEGSEGAINKAFLFVKSADDENGTNPSYKMLTIGQGQKQLTVKFPMNQTMVYVIANPTTTLENALPKQGDLATLDDAKMRDLMAKIDKSYFSGLNTTTGSFIMTGRATINNALGVSPYVLPIELKREVVKVSFKVAIAGENQLVINSVGDISVCRTAQEVLPFTLDGVTEWGYALTLGQGEVGYVADAGADNVTAGAGATDYTYAYTYDVNDKDATHYLYKNFYVSPNYAQKAERSTVIILKANVTPDGGVAADKFYRARVSADLGSYQTQRNAHYIITATLKGAGYDTKDEALKEKMDNQLVVNVKMKNWSLITSDQTLE